DALLCRARRAGARIRAGRPRRVARAKGVREDRPDGGLREDLRARGGQDAGRMSGGSRATEPVTNAVRLAIYRAIERGGSAPGAADVARALGLETAVVEDCYRALADAHVIVLQPQTL